MRSKFYDLLATRSCLNLSSALIYHQSFGLAFLKTVHMWGPSSVLNYQCNFSPPPIEILKGKKVIDYRLSMQTYVADETHNWNLRVCNPCRVICDLVWSARSVYAINVLHCNVHVDFFLLLLCHICTVPQCNFVICDIRLGNQCTRELFPFSAAPVSHPHTVHTDSV